MANLIPTLVGASQNRAARTTQAAQNIGSQLSSIGKEHKDKALWKIGKEFISEGNFGKGAAVDFMNKKKAQGQDISEEQMGQILLYTKIFLAKQKAEADIAKTKSTTINPATRKLMDDLLKAQASKLRQKDTKKTKLNSDQASAVKLMHFKSKGWVPNELGGYDKIDPKTGEKTPVTQQEINNEEIQLQNIIAETGGNFNTLSGGYQKIFNSQAEQAANIPPETGIIGDIGRGLKKASDIAVTGIQEIAAPLATKILRDRFIPKQDVPEPTPGESLLTPQRMNSFMNSLVQDGQSGQPRVAPPRPQQGVASGLPTNRPNAEAIQQGLVNSLASQPQKPQITPEQMVMIVKELDKRGIKLGKKGLEGSNINEEELMNVLNEITQGK
jgi:hypothetical protein